MKTQNMNRDEFHLFVGFAIRFKYPFPEYQKHVYMMMYI